MLHLIVPHESPRSELKRLVGPSSGPGGADGSTGKGAWDGRAGTTGRVLWGGGIRLVTPDDGWAPQVIREPHK